MKEMSSDLIWEPMSVRPQHRLPTALKFALRKFGEPIDMVISVGSDEFAYLEVLASENVDGARRLLAVLAKHGEIRIREVW